VTALLLIVFFFGTGLLHVAWAFGMTWGLSAALPERPGGLPFAPSRGATLLVAAALGALGALVCFHGGILTPLLPHRWTRILLLLASAAFALRAIGEFRLVGFFKRVRATRFATFDSFLFSPLCAAVALGLWALART
jgi:hypothetical protein